MREVRAVDVLIAGGGMAGASVAAALAGMGLDLLLVEPGLDPRKRLAGELIHPPGTTDLAELGLLDALQASGGVPVQGFAVWGDGRTHLLPYARVAGLCETGFAMEHAAIADTLRRAVGRLSHVTVWDGTRVTAVDQTQADAVRVRVSRSDGDVEVAARLLVVADGAASAVRRLAGIHHTRRRISTMLGYLLHQSRLPDPGFGTIFLDGPAMALAYHIGAGTVRVMFDLPHRADEHSAAERVLACVETLPQPLHNDVRRALDAQPGLASASYSVVPEAVARHRVVLVGDAAGCCHPLTATGLSVSTRDAIRLRDALRASPGDLTAALRRYAAQREGRERTRQALAEALYAVFAAGTPETRLLRQGLLRYWASSPRGRAASMALLSTREDRMSVMAREYARVVRHTLPGLLTRAREGEQRSLVVRARTALNLSLATLRYAGATLWALRS